MSGIAQAHLFARLFEDVAGLWLVLKPADAFASNDLVGPMLGNEAVEVDQIEGLAAIVNKGADAIFLHLAAVVMVVVMMVLVFVMMVFVLLVVVFMVIFVLVFVMMMVPFLFLIVVVMVLNGVNPCGRCSHFVEIEAVGVDELV